jgi:hypothetical protein
METVHGKRPQLDENDLRGSEARALDHLDRNLGMNYDAGFGSLLEDTAAADLARTRREHEPIEE